MRRRGAGGASHNDFIALGEVVQIGESRLEFCMAELKIQKIGDSLGVILPPDVVERLQLREGQTLYASNGPNGTVSISLVAPERKDVMAVAEDLANRYHETLKALAK